MPASPDSVDDGFFNDLSRQPHSDSRGSYSPQEQNGRCANGDEGGSSNKKRIACVICRRRKLKCDGNRPKCATCARLGHECAYDEVRRKSGPKRGYVKDLEARLAQVESALKQKDKSNEPETIHEEPRQNGHTTISHQYGETIGINGGMQQSMPQASFPINEPMSIPNMTTSVCDILPEPLTDMNLDRTWEVIGLGLQEPLPPQEVIDELNETFFLNIHPSLPMIHKPRFYTSMMLAPEKRPPVCLRYIMWCLAASVTDKYMHCQELFYQRARKYIHLDEMKGQGEVFVSIAHAQCWVLIGGYEFKMMYFPRAWMSVGRAARMVLMMGLNRVDGVGLDVKQCLPPPRDWTEREERRRVFWMSYCVDRYASIGTGWPMCVDEKDIMTCLPASEQSYENGIEQKTLTLQEVIRAEELGSLSSFAGVVLVTHFFGLNLTHLHRPEPNQQENNMRGIFWQRHQNMDNLLFQTSIKLPSHLRLPAGIKDPNVLFLNLAIHTSAICLHQAAIFKMEKNQLPLESIEQSKRRCLVSAQAIEDNIKSSHGQDIISMNPFTAFCLYVAARVFVQYLKRMHDDSRVRSQLEFILMIMRIMQKKNPLTESFLVQLKLDIEGSGLDLFLHNPDFSSTYMEGKQQQQDSSNGTYRCSPILNLSETSSEGRSPNAPQAQGTPNQFGWTEHLKGRSPENTYPSVKAWEARSDPPSLRAESRIQKQYAIRNIEAIKRTGTTMKSFFPETDARPDQYFPNGGWGSSGSNIQQGSGWSSTSSNDNGPIGLNPVIDYGINVNGFDTEMSDQQNTSTGLTPQSNSSVNNSSSNMYSPPTLQDEDSAHSQQAGHTSSISGQFGSYNSTFSPPSENNMMSGQGSSNSRSPINENVNVSGISGLEEPFNFGAEGTPNWANTPDGGWQMNFSMQGWDNSGQIVDGLSAPGGLGD